MSTPYTELVVEGSFAQVKGFLVGFKIGKGEEFEYFFHRKSGIRLDTLAELLKGVFEMDNYVHLCVEQKMLEPLKQAIAKATPQIGISVKKERLIKSANFHFSFNISNKQAAGRVKKILGSLPEGVNLKEYRPVEEVEKDATSTGGYAPMHAYNLKGDGLVQGDFGGVMETFLNIKRMPESELVLTDDIVLGF